MEACLNTLFIFTAYLKAKHLFTLKCFAFGLLAYLKHFKHSD
ncbi:hypothetical protein PMAN_a2383 [Pseudoalteromonas marina]|nr:hypothetical protein PMAN_a2383 [Pseudoalteromonas marina]